VKDWPTLEAAVEQKIEDQTEFVRWWKETVRSDGNPGTGAGPRRLARDDAEDITGITKQTVSKWAKGHRDIPSYRDQLVHNQLVCTWKRQ
jgi:hypothetical protein